MSILKTQINSRSQAFSDNAEHMQSLVDDLETLVEKIKQGGGERYQARHQARGKLLPRDRIDLLLDPGSPFWSFLSLRLKTCTAKTMYQQRASSQALAALPELSALSWQMTPP